MDESRAGKSCHFAKYVKSESGAESIAHLMLNVQGLTNLGKEQNNSLREKKTPLSLLLSFPGILHYSATVLTHTLCFLLILVKGLDLSFNRTSQGSSYSKAM